MAYQLPKVSTRYEDEHGAYKIKRDVMRAEKFSDIDIDDIKDLIEVKGDMTNLGIKKVTLLVDITSLVKTT